MPLISVGAGNDLAAAATTREPQASCQGWEQGCAQSIHRACSCAKNVSQGVYMYACAHLYLKICILPIAISNVYPTYIYVYICTYIVYVDID